MNCLAGGIDTQVKKVVEVPGGYQATEPRQLGLVPLSKPGRSAMQQGDWCNHPDREATPHPCGHGRIQDLAQSVGRRGVTRRSNRFEGWPT